MSFVVPGRDADLGEIAFVIDVTIRIRIGDDCATCRDEAAGAVDGAASRVCHLCFHKTSFALRILEEARALVKELLMLDDNYKVLFLGGGASLQFLMVAYNLLEKKGAYLKTGVWAANAIKEAKYLGNVEVVALT